MEPTKNQHFLKRFNFALAGIWHALKTEKSFKTQILLTLFLFGILFFLKPSALWTSIFGLCVSQVLSLELVNAALESLCDEVSQKENPKIKVAKDCAAGAVLISSLISVFIFLIFLLSR